MSDKRRPIGRIVVAPNRKKGADFKSVKVAAIWPSRFAPAEDGTVNLGLSFGDRDLSKEEALELMGRDDVFLNVYLEAGSGAAADEESPF